MAVSDNVKQVGRKVSEAAAEKKEEIKEAVREAEVAADAVELSQPKLRTPTMTLGKSFDTHGPLGPWIVSADELGDPHALGIRTYVNDELRQDGSTSEMIYDCFQQVAHLSEAFTLEPGDVIATGTPAGIGAVRQPFPEGLLKVGDVVRVEIDGIGELENTVVDEPVGFVVPASEDVPAWAA